MLASLGILVGALAATEFSLQVTSVAALVTILLKLKPRPDLHLAWCAGNCGD